MSKELEVKFEPFELPEDYKFIYKIRSCEHKIDFDTNIIVDKILSTRIKKVDEEVIKQLINIGKEKDINELILIDESKVLKMIKSVKAFEIIKEKSVDTVAFIRCCCAYRYSNSEDIVNIYNQMCADPYVPFGEQKKTITKEECDLLKETLL